MFIRCPPRDKEQQPRFQGLTGLGEYTVGMLVELGRTGDLGDPSGRDDGPDTPSWEVCGRAAARRDVHVLRRRQRHLKRKDMFL